MGTYWKKNLDARYISGEDLKNGELMGKGLRPEMVVTIASFEDKKTFDQNNNAETTKTGLFLKEYPSGKDVYKPVILNNTNGRFLESEFKSILLEDWIGKPVILWAMPDRRFGHVARFKKYYPPAQVSDVNALEKLNACTSKDQVNEVWKELSADGKKLPTVKGLIDKLKTQFA